ncbi:MAG: Fic family protein [Bergeyella sp.]|nr:Fic family protein [Bergeyella sp.]
MENNPISKEAFLFIVENTRSFYETLGAEFIMRYTESELDEVYNCMERVYTSGYYEEPHEKYANVMYNISKGHFLSNGNKRIALMITAAYILYETDILPEWNHLKDLVLAVTQDKVSKEQLCIELKRYCK